MLTAVWFRTKMKKGSKEEITMNDDEKVVTKGMVTTLLFYYSDT
jgi:hypothetical protein